MDYDYKITANPDGADNLVGAVAGANVVIVTQCIFIA